MSVDTPPATDAVSVWAPAASPSVQVVLARPAASVAAVAGSADPCPSAAEKVTVAPATGEPPASSTRTTTASASALPAIPSCPPPDTTTMAAGPRGDSPGGSVAESPQAARAAMTGMLRRRGGGPTLPNAVKTAAHAPALRCGT